MIYYMSNEDTQYVYIGVDHSSWASDNNNITPPPKKKHFQICWDHWPEMSD